MKNRYCQIFLLFFTYQLLLAQTDANQNIAVDAIEKYFELERENIHLSVNKNAFMTNESIWFKGTVIAKKSQLLYPFTANVLVNLIDNDGKIIVNQLVYAEDGIFSGSIPLDKKIKSGTYFLQVYTNFMNNFAENESTVYKIKIYNSDEDNYMPSSAVDLSSINIQLFPESSVFLNGITNTIAIQVADCSGNVPIIDDAKVIDQAGNEITNFIINAQGVGRFDIKDTKYEVYKIVFNCQGKSFEKQLPLPQVKGVALSINNYTFEGKTFITLKTNSATLADIKNKKTSLFVLGNAKINLVNAVFSEALETKFVIPSSEFFKGINTVFLVDDNNEKIAERIIFFPVETKFVDLKILSKTGNKFVIKGNSNLKAANLSVSVLPSASICIEKNENAINQLLFSNNLEVGLKNTNYFFSDYSPKKNYELDMELMTKKSRYTWGAITGASPSKTFEFDKGINIKGIANVDMKNNEQRNVKMSSIFSGIGQKTLLNDKNEFFFNNIFVQDSTKLYFELFKSNGQKQTLRAFTQMVNPSRKFNKSLNIEKIKCNLIATNAEKIIFPTTANVVNLKEIEIDNKKKASILTRDISMATGYKITDDMCKNYMDIFSFLRANGYYVTRGMGDFRITPIGGIVGIRASLGSPAIFVNNVQEFDFSLLDIYTFCDIDEIHINRRGGGGGPEATNGIIYIFTKKMTNVSTAPEASQSQAFIVKNGFKKPLPYVSPNYFLTTEPAFQQFGSIHWISDVLTDNEGNFQFTMPVINQTEVKIVIEGVDAEGNIVSQVRNLKL